MIDLRTINPQLPGTSPLHQFKPFVYSNKLEQQPVINNETAVNLKST